MATAVESSRIVSGGPRPAPGTLVQLFFDAVERYDKPDALQSKVNGVYQPISHRTLADRVQHVGARASGARDWRAAHRVGILSENRPEWAIADYACLTSGLVDVPVYPTLPAEQIAYILNDAGVDGDLRVHGRAGGQDRRGAPAAARAAARHRLRRHALARRGPHARGARGARRGGGGIANRRARYRRRRCPRSRTTWRRSSTRRAPRASRRA